MLLEIPGSLRFFRSNSCVSMFSIIRSPTSHGFLNTNTPTLSCYHEDTCIDDRRDRHIDGGGLCACPACSPDLGDVAATTIMRIDQASAPLKGTIHGGGPGPRRCRAGPTSWRRTRRSQPQDRCREDGKIERSAMTVLLYHRKLEQGLLVSVQMFNRCPE